MKQGTMKNSLLLFLAALIWGVAFVAQSVGMDYVGPLTFNGLRFLMGGAVLLPLIAFRKNKGIFTEEEKRKQRKIELTGGLSCGAVLCIASLLQQYGIQYTSVGKAGFITALYIIMVPIIGIFLGKKMTPLIGGGAVLAAAGFYFLCITETVGINKGDILVFVSAVCFSFHILLIDYFAPKMDGVKLSCIQFFVSGIVCTTGAFLLEEPTWSGIVAGAAPLLYAGILSCGVAYTLQVVGQVGVNPTVASLILSLESVISVLAGWVLLHESMTDRQLFGCVLVFTAVILAQLPAKQKQMHNFNLSGDSR